jgi:cyclophilin family peptidyl-prolyl cis-trans isomerase
MKKATSKLVLSSLLISFIFISAQQPKPKPKSPIKPKTENKIPTPPKDQLVEVQTSYGKMVIKLYNETPLHRDNFIKLVQQGFYDSLLFHRVIREFMVQGGDPESKNAPAGTMLGNGEYGKQIPAEFNTNLIHKRGALAAARTDNPLKESSGCQFYIVQGKRFSMTDLTNYRNSANFQAKTKLLQDVTNSDSVKARIDDYKVRGDKDGLHSYMLSLQPVIDDIYKKMEYFYTPSQLSTYTTIGGAPHLDMNYTVFGEVIEGLNVIDSIAANQVDQFSRPLKDVRMKMKLLK